MVLPYTAAYGVTMGTKIQRSQTLQYVLESLRDKLLLLLLVVVVVVVVAVVMNVISAGKLL
jgi:flagellar biosynthesis protein FlhB